MSLLYVMNLFGVGVFAVSGVLAAARKHLDLLGVLVVATVAAIGGGTLRDLLLGRHPIFWFRETENLVVIVVASLATLAYLRYRRPPEGALLIADALGLGVFTIGGAEIATATGLTWVIAVIMGVITGVAGGMIRDVLTAEIPLVLRRGHLYATAASIGATAYLLLDSMGVPHAIASVAGMVTVVALRLGSIAWGWHLPAFRLESGAKE